MDEDQKELEALKTDFFTYLKAGDSHKKLIL